MNYLREKTTDWSKGTKFYKKFEFMKSEILYMGHKLSSVRFLPHQNKINAITLLQLPTNVKDLRLFLGKAICSFKFLFNFVDPHLWSYLLEKVPREIVYQNKSKNLISSYSSIARRLYILIPMPILRLLLILLQLMRVQFYHSNNPMKWFLSSWQHRF